MSILARILGLQDATRDGLRLAKIIAILMPAFAASFQISTTFWMIHIATSLGGGDYILGLTMVGSLLVLQFGIQTILDFPTGALGDHIGHRFVIASALLCYAVAYWLTSLIVNGAPFYIYVLIYALLGLGASQESGAFNAWFDNNYRVAMPHDTDREQYGVFMGKLHFLFQVISTLVLIPGSILAYILNRNIVFAMQAVFCVILAMAVLTFMKDLPGAREVREEKPTVREYAGLMVDGLRFLFSNRFITFVVFGEVLIWSTGTIWWNLILFPFYFSYMITDIAVSSFRTLIFLPQAATAERSGIWAKRFEPKKWIPRLRFLQFMGFVFFVALALTTTIFTPPVNPTEFVGLYIPFTDIPLLVLPVESVIPVSLTFTIFFLSGIAESICSVLNQRIMIDVIPSRIRNTMYSLTPTIVMLLSMPLLMIFGWILPTFGFGLTFGLCSLIAFGGGLLIRKGYSYPIPKIKEIVPAPPDEQEVVETLEIT